MNRVTTELIDVDALSTSDEQFTNQMQIANYVENYMGRYQGGDEVDQQLLLDSTPIFLNRYVIIFNFRLLQHVTDVLLSLVGSRNSS